MSTQWCKSGVAVVLLPDHIYHKQFSQKVLMSLIFMLWEESAKTTKIMWFENLALYGSYRKQ